MQDSKKLFCRYRKGRKTIFLPDLFHIERMNFLVVQISKDEAVEVRKRFKSVSIYKTMKQANHHKYWVCETQEVLSFLDKYRKRNVVEHLE